MQPADRPTRHNAANDTSIASYETANDRMKRRSAAWLPRSLVLAVILHAALFTLAPTMTTADVHGDRDGDMVMIPPALVLPPPPEPIARPAAPVVGSVDISDQVTIPDTRPEAWTPDLLPPPVRVPERERSGFERFTLSMVAPYLLNPQEVERELARTYPSVLREAGIGGQVDVNLWLDETGAVVRAEIGRGSGYSLFDEAALKVVGAMRLAPAQNRGTPVRVIVTLPVRFNVQR